MLITLQILYGYITFPDFSKYELR